MIGIPHAFQSGRLKILAQLAIIGITEMNRPNPLWLLKKYSLEILEKLLTKLLTVNLIKIQLLTATSLQIELALKYVLLRILII